MYAHHTPTFVKPNPTALLGHPSFGPDIFPASSMLRVFDLLDPRNLIAEDLRVRLLTTACGWLETKGDPTTSHGLLLEELEAVVGKAETTAKGIGFDKLTCMRDKFPQGFRRLISVAPYLSEKLAKYVRSCLTYMFLPKWEKADDSFFINIIRCKECKRSIRQSSRGISRCVKGYAHTFVEDAWIDLSKIE